jgi:hypothetical protein
MWKVALQRCNVECLRWKFGPERWKVGPERWNVGPWRFKSFIKSVNLKKPNPNLLFYDKIHIESVIK